VIIQGWAIRCRVLLLLPDIQLSSHYR